MKSFKAHIRKISEPYKYTFEEFTTLLARIEACLNSRPISSQSQNASDLFALTPYHFLTGGPILYPVDPSTTETDSNDLRLSIGISVLDGKPNI